MVRLHKALAVLGLLLACFVVYYSLTRIYNPPPQAKVTDQWKPTADIKAIPTGTSPELRKLLVILHSTTGEYGRAPIIQRLSTMPTQELIPAIPFLIDSMSTNLAFDPDCPIFYGVGPPAHSLARDLLIKLGEPAVPALIEATRSESPIIRRNAIDALRKKNTPQVTNALIAALKDTNPVVRSGAAAALSQRKSLRVRHALLKATRDKDLRVRTDVSRALWGNKSERVTKALIYQLLNDKRPTSRAQAATSLGYRSGKLSHDALNKARKSDPDHEVREAAREALSSMPSSKKP